MAATNVVRTIGNRSRLRCTHERHGRPEEVQDDVREAEQGGRVGDRLEALLDGALDVDADRLLDGDDVGRVREGGLDVLAAAHDLVEAVESGQACDLAGAGMGV